MHALKKFRQIKDLSQEQLAEIMDCTQSFLSKVENDHYLPSAKMVKRVMEKYGCAAEDLGFRLRIDWSIEPFVVDDEAVDVVGLEAGRVRPASEDNEETGGSLASEEQRNG